MDDDVVVSWHLSDERGYRKAALPHEDCFVFEQELETRIEDGREGHRRHVRHALGDLKEQELLRDANLRRSKSNAGVVLQGAFHIFDERFRPRRSDFFLLVGHRLFAKNRVPHSKQFQHASRRHCSKIGNESISRTPA